MPTRMKRGYKKAPTKKRADPQSSTYERKMYKKVMKRTYKKKK